MFGPLVLGDPRLEDRPQRRMAADLRVKHIDQDRIEASVIVGKRIFAMIDRRYIQRVSYRPRDEAISRQGSEIDAKSSCAGGTNWVLLSPTFDLRNAMSVMCLILFACGEMWWCRSAVGSRALRSDNG